MLPIVSLPDPGDFDRPLGNDQPTGLLGDDLLAYQLAAAPEQLAAEWPTERFRLIEEGAGAFLAEAGSRRSERAVLPEFGTPAEPDLHACSRRRSDVDLRVRGDELDADPDNAPHRQVVRAVPALRGGASIDDAGPAEVTVQLERPSDLSVGPTVTLAIAVNGIEQYAWLTPAEARALQQAIGSLITEADA